MAVVTLLHADASQKIKRPEAFFYLPIQTCCEGIIPPYTKLY